MIIDTDVLDQVKQTTDCRDWRTFKLSPTEKARFLVKGINTKAYRIAQERLTENLRVTCGNLTTVNDYEETTLAKHMTIVAYHLVEDWEGIYNKASNMEVPFTHDSLATILKYSGDLGIVMQGWILEQAQDIQRIHDEEQAKLVGKPWSFSDSISKASDQKNFSESENDSEDQELLNQKSE